MISLLKKDVNLCLSQLDYNNPGVGIGFTLQSFVCLIYCLLSVLQVIIVRMIYDR